MKLMFQIGCHVMWKESQFLLGHLNKRMLGYSNKSAWIDLNMPAIQLITRNSVALQALKNILLLEIHRRPPSSRVSIRDSLLSAITEHLQNTLASIYCLVRNTTPVCAHSDQTQPVCIQFNITYN